ncbi:MAG: hypothetical protein ACOVOR_02005 [Rhabdochlamydiaceae bacterium]
MVEAGSGVSATNKDLGTQKKESHGGASFKDFYIKDVSETDPDEQKKRKSQHEIEQDTQTKAEELSLTSKSPVDLFKSKERELKIKSSPTSSSLSWQQEKELDQRLAPLEKKSPISYKQKISNINNVSKDQQKDSPSPLQMEPSTEVTETPITSELPVFLTEEHLVEYDASSSNLPYYTQNSNLSNVQQKDIQDGEDPLLNLPLSQDLPLHTAPFLNEGAILRRKGLVEENPKQDHESSNIEKEKHRLINPVSGLSSPKENYLFFMDKDTHDLLTKIVGVITCMSYNKNSALDSYSLTAIELNGHEYINSLFYGTTIQIKEYGTAKGELEIKLLFPSYEALSRASKNIDHLTKAFEAPKYQNKNIRVRISAETRSPGMIEGS